MEYVQKIIVRADLGLTQDAVWNKDVGSFYASPMVYNRIR